MREICQRMGRKTEKLEEFKDQNDSNSVTVPINPDQATQGAINVQVEHKFKGDHGVSFNY